MKLAQTLAIYHVTLIDYDKEIYAAMKKIVLTINGAVAHSLWQLICMDRLRLNF